MKIKLSAKKIELTEAIKSYVLEKASKLSKLLKKIEDSGGEVMASFDVGKNTKHHKSGKVFHCDCSITIDGEKFYLSSDEEDLYKAVDVVKEGLWKEISRNKTKKQTLKRRGAKSVKDDERSNKEKPSNRHLFKKEEIVYKKPS